jgi:thymidylate synthase
MSLNVDEQYLNLLRKVLENGKLKKGRNGNVITSFSEKLDIDIKDSFPLLTTKKVFIKGVIEELLFFIKGDTNAVHLQDKGIHIWDGNTTREFLDNLGLTHYNVGDMGPMYGFQWRHFNAEYFGPDHDYSGQGFDQLQNCINLIRNDPFSRRIFMSAYNPLQLHQSVLNPCHLSYQWMVELDENGNKLLNCLMYQRSADLFLGLPFNIASTALLTYMIAHITDCKPNKMSICICDAHIYEEHIDAVKIQLERTPIELPTLSIERKIEDINDFKYDDLLIENYVSHPTIKAKMIA